ncbi:MAG: cytochrome C, partial [Betaproteobacteria bacterium]|nr:cytochrome C [Betaproteobacteria bacterium]
MCHRKFAAYRFRFLGVMGVALAVLAGCSGNDGAPGAAGPAGSVPVTNAAALSVTDLQSLSITGTVTSVTNVAANPVVDFTLKDAAGKGIPGLGFTSQSATATLPGLTNIQFALAKLVPGTSGSPSRWVSYIVTSVPTTTVPNVVPQRPGTDNTGTLVDHGDGSYTYTFYRNITQVAADVAASTDSGNNFKADLGDLTYDGSLTHRLVIQIGGSVRGTGNNTPDAVTLTPT